MQSKLALELEVEEIEDWAAHLGFADGLAAREPDPDPEWPSEVLTLYSRSYREGLEEAKVRT